MSMLRKTVYIFSPLVMWLATTSLVLADWTDSPCVLNGKSVPCADFGPGLAIAGTFFLGFFIVMMILVVITVVSLWKIFSKAGKPGWASIIPIYNTIVMLEVAERPLWWIFLFFVPVVNLVMAIIMLNDISTRFGKGVGFTIGLLILPIIFYPILAFDKSTYHPRGMNMGSSMTPPPMPPQQM